MIFYRYHLVLVVGGWWLVVAKVGKLLKKVRVSSFRHHMWTVCADPPTLVR